MGVVRWIRIGISSAVTLSRVRAHLHILIMANISLPRIISLAVLGCAGVCIILVILALSMPWYGSKSSVKDPKASAGFSLHPFYKWMYCHDKGWYV